MRANVLASGPRMVSLAAMAKRVTATTVARHDPGASRAPVTAFPSDRWPMASREASLGSNDGTMSEMLSGESRRSWIAVARGIRR